MEPCRIELKGKTRAASVIFALVESGYSVHAIHLEVEQEHEKEEDRYYVIEYSFTKYGSPSFILEEE